MSEVNEYDVAIIGGGLAGLSLAIQCANAGFETALYEKELYPFHKVCGEYISMESYPFIQSLGIDLAAFCVPFIDQLTVSDVSGRPYNFDLPLGGFGISRYTLDAALHKVALQKGVTVIHTKVNDILFDDDHFYIDCPVQPGIAKVAAGTFGKRSNIDIKWKRTFTSKKASGVNYVGIKYHVRYAHAPNNISLHNFKDGYCGISAIEEGKSCLCYLTTSKQLQVAGSIGQLEKKVLSKNVQLKQIFDTATFLYDEPLAISQISFAPKAPVENHVLMVGDAAGLITPLCGNGMSMAMHASKICFKEIEAFLVHKISRPQMEQQYEQQWKKHFEQRLLIGRTVQQFFGHPVSTHLFLKFMKTFPGIARQLIKSTHGTSF